MAATSAAAAAAASWAFWTSAALGTDGTGVLPVGVGLGSRWGRGCGSSSGGAGHDATATASAATTAPLQTRTGQPMSVISARQPVRTLEVDRIAETLLLGTVPARVVPGVEAVGAPVDVAERGVLPVVDRAGRRVRGVGGGDRDP